MSHMKATKVTSKAVTRKSERRAVLLLDVVARFDSSRVSLSVGGICAQKVLNSTVSEFAQPGFLSHMLDGWLDDQRGLYLVSLLHKNQPLSN